MNDGYPATKPVAIATAPSVPDGPAPGAPKPYAGHNVLPQLDDPRVREMADRNHRPDEAWTLGGDCFLTCRQCAQGWPCPTRRAVDAFGGTR